MRLAGRCGSRLGLVARCDDALFRAEESFLVGRRRGRAAAAAAAAALCRAESPSAVACTSCVLVSPPLVERFEQAVPIRNRNVSKR